MNPEKILIVDDDAELLTGLRRLLRTKFKIFTSTSPMDAISIFKTKGPFAVVVADMHMPNINGIQFLAGVRKASADTIRMLLTGDSDLETAVNAVNEGEIFRYLLKPCPPETMIGALEAALKQFRLVNADRILLGNTLDTSIQTLTDIMAMARPCAFGRAKRVRNYVTQIVEYLKLPEAWRFELAASLSQLGLVSIPEETIERYTKNDILTDDEKRMISGHPAIGQGLVVNIPRLENVAEMIGRQLEPCGNFRLDPKNPAAADEIVLGSALLKVANFFDILMTSGKSRDEAVAIMSRAPNEYEPLLTRLLHNINVSVRQSASKPVKVAELREGQLIAEDIKTKDDRVLIPKDTVINQAVRHTLLNFHRQNQLGELVRIYVTK